jgi:hypothetical protein
MARTLTRRVKVMDDPSLPVRVSRGLRSTYALSYGRDPIGRGGAGCTILLRAENTHGFGHLSKNDFMLSRSTASVWPDEAGGCHDRGTGCRCDLVCTAGAKAMATAKPTMVKTNGATIAAVKSCSILSTPKRGGCNPV